MFYTCNILAKKLLEKSPSKKSLGVVTICVFALSILLTFFLHNAFTMHTDLVEKFLVSSVQHTAY